MEFALFVVDEFFTYKLMADTQLICNLIGFSG